MAQTNQPADLNTPTHSMKRRGEVTETKVVLKSGLYKSRNPVWRGCRLKCIIKRGRTTYEIYNPLTDTTTQGLKNPPNDFDPEFISSLRSKKGEEEVDE